MKKLQMIKVMEKTIELIKDDANWVWRMFWEVKGEEEEIIIDDLETAEKLNHENAIEYWMSVKNDRTELVFMLQDAIQELKDGKEQNMLEILKEAEAIENEYGDSPVMTSCLLDIEGLIKEEK